MTSNDNDQLHLLERININLQVQNSIVPSAYSLAKFKVSGHLPSLQINLSDTKYKSLIRLIDVAIPNFDDESDLLPRPALAKQKSGAHAFRLPSGMIFGKGDQDYHLDDDPEVSDKDGDVQPNPDSNSDQGELSEVEDGSIEVLYLPFVMQLLKPSSSRLLKCYSTWLRWTFVWTLSAHHSTNLTLGLRGSWVESV